MKPCNGNHAATTPFWDPTCPKYAAAQKVIDMPQPKKPEPEKVTVTLILLLARLCGLLQRVLGRVQTQLLTIAQSWGWTPDSRYAELLLRKRQVALAVRGGMREVARRERHLEKQIEKSTKRFTKTYPS